MVVLEYCAKHNMIAYLEKIEENAQFHEIVDFLSRSLIFYALTDRIKKLEKRCKPSIQHYQAWLRSVSKKKKLSKRKSVSKQGRKNAKSRPTKDGSDKRDAELDEVMEYIDTKEALNEGRQITVSTGRLDVDTARPDVITLNKLKDDKAKGVAFKDSGSTDRPARSILTLRPLLTIDLKDKGKGVLEEHGSTKKMTKSDFDFAQIARDKEIDRQLEVELQAEEEKANVEDELWHNQEKWSLKSWNFYENYGVHILVLEDDTEIHMLAERRYPLTTRTIERMMSLRLIIVSASDVAYDLLRFIQKKIDESREHDRGEKDL
uniref:Uncharacterized protein n=1 Tax=Tanacetum cinerariifolium TaxID=118510 RepID=A0A6L2L294_TANCI|nr:hypothetical protein [Tanacetum cinerariifolium]